MNNQNSDMSDDELITGYLEGDSSCFNQLLERYKLRLFNYIYKSMGNKQESEDIFQEVFYKVIENLKHYRKEGHFKAWLFRIATHLCIDRVRQKNKRNTLSLQQQVAGEETGEIALEEVIASDSPTPANTVDERELQQLLEKEIDGLSGEQKEVVCLRIYAGLSFKEISQVLSCSINTVLSRMQYAIGHLRSKLTKTGVIHEL